MSKGQWRSVKANPLADIQAAKRRLDAELSDTRQYEQAIAMRDAVELQVLITQNKALRARVAELEAQIAELEAQIIARGKR